MRILHVTNTLRPSFGGPVAVVRELTHLMTRLGHDVEILTFDKGCERHLDECREVVVHAIGPSFSHYGFTPQAHRWLRGKCSRYDCIIAHNIFLYGGAAVWRAVRGRRIPYFVFLHGSLDPWFRGAYPAKHVKKGAYWFLVGHRIVEDACAVLYTTDEERRLAKSTFRPFDSADLVVPYGVESLSLGDPDVGALLLGRFAELKNRRIILFLGRIHRKKGCDLALLALSRVVKDHPEVHLLVVGNDESGTRAGLEQYASSLGIAAHVTWAGPLYGREKDSAFAVAEAFLLPSHTENFAVAVAEALSVALPVLVSDKVNIWPKIRAAGAGLVDTDDADGATRLLSTFLDMSAANRQVMCQAARACFESEFCLEANVERISSMLIEAVQRYRDRHCLGSLDPMAGRFQPSGS